MSKPHWDDAPRWAGWLAQDSNGDWFWYESRPFLPVGGVKWIGRGEWARKTPSYESFGLTLEARP